MTKRAIAALGGMAIAVALTSSAAAQVTPAGLDPEHYECYEPDPAPTFVPENVTLRDQFRRIQLQAIDVAFLCTPVSKNGQRLADKLSHLVCYDLSTNTPINETVVTSNQFGQHRFRLGVAKLLCLPSLKRVVP